MDRLASPPLHSTYLVHGAMYHSAYDINQKPLKHATSSHTLDPPTIHIEGPGSKLKSSSVGNLSADNISLKDGTRPKKAKNKALSFWNPDDVNKWLRKQCSSLYQPYGDLLRQHEINGRSLVRLTDWKLSMIGMNNSAHREELLRQIVRLKLKFDSQELKALQEQAVDDKG